MTRTREGAALLPNIRRLFIPDPGHIILDVDLSGADAQVVAWEAEDEDLKEAFRQGLDVHVKNATDMWGEEFTSLDSNGVEFERRRQKCKHSVHAFDYGAKARTVAITQGWTIAEAKAFERRWFSLHPGIRTNFHDNVRDSLERHHKVANRFGFHIYYFDRPESVFTDALAWIPQSTVAITSLKGALQVRAALPWVQILLQVHDSLVLQIPKNRQRDIPLIRRHLLNTIPYDDPLTIPWGVALSDKSWGHVRKTKWEDTPNMQF